MDNNTDKTNTGNDYDLLELWPQHLLCLLCMNGGASLPFMEKHELKKKLEKIKTNPDIHIKLITAFDEIGVQTETFNKQTPLERKRDLDVLQKLGLLPNTIRTARVLLKLINENIKNLQGTCAAGFMTADAWHDCPLASAGYFDKGKEGIIKSPDPDEKNKAKEDSSRMINEADHLSIRVHHLLCILCSIGENADKPNKENNIYEVIQRIIRNPDIPVTVVEGCSKCMICRPCSNFRADRRICVSLSGLRDRLKDLTVFQKLGLSPGDTIPAKQLYKMIAEKIPDTFGICQYEKETYPEWKNCKTLGAYEKGKNKIMEMLE